MTVTVVDQRGMALMCETEGCRSPASSAWSGSYGPPRRACDAHNPWHNTAMPLPLNFTSQPLCHACGQPVNLGAQVIYPGTNGISTTLPGTF